LAHDPPVVELAARTYVIEKGKEILENIIHFYKDNTNIQFVVFGYVEITNFQNVCCTCSSKESIELCNITVLNRSGQPYLKYPKLFELHDKLFQCVPNNLHNSLIDILVTLRCFMKLKYSVDININCSKFKKLVKINKVF
jgi:hypothetical protein